MGGSYIARDGEWRSSEKRVLGFGSPRGVTGGLQQEAGDSSGSGLGFSLCACTQWLKHACETCYAVCIVVPSSDLCPIPRPQESTGMISSSRKEMQ